LVEVSTFPPPSVPTQSEVVGHERLRNCGIPPGDPTAVDFHLLAPPPGDVEVKMVPLLSAATQKDGLGHEMPERPAVEKGTEGEGTPGSSAVALQAEAPRLGLREVRTFPAVSTAAQKEVEGHEIARIPVMKGFAEPRLSALKMRQPAAPLRGAVDVAMSPCASPATHSDREGHDTAVRESPCAGPAPPP
jgi:hypothetical protein